MTANNSLQDQHLLLNAQLESLHRIPGVHVRDIRELIHDYLEVKDGKIQGKLVLPAADFLQKEIVDCFVQGEWGKYMPLFISCRDLAEDENFDSLVLPYAMKWWDAITDIELIKINGKYQVTFDNHILVDNASSIEEAIVAAFKATHPMTT